MGAMWVVLSTTGTIAQRLQQVCCVSSMSPLRWLQNASGCARTLWTSRMLSFCELWSCLGVLCVVFVLLYRPSRRALACGVSLPSRTAVHSAGLDYEVKNAQSSTDVALYVNEQYPAAESDCASWSIVRPSASYTKGCEDATPSRTGPNQQKKEEVV